MTGTIPAMRNTARSLILAAALLLPVAAAAQVPQFPQTLPANTVIGHLGTQPGPSQAIPFTVLAAQLQLYANIVQGPTTTTVGHFALWNSGNGTLLSDGGAPGTGVLAALLNSLNATGGLVGFNGALGTPLSGTLTNATGLPISTGVSGLGTGVATALGVAVGSAGAPVVNGGSLGTPSSGTLTNATGLPIGSGVSGLGSGCATFLGTPSSANLRGCLTDEVGTGSAYFVGGALGAPASGTLTNATGLPILTGVSGLGTGIATALGIATGSAGAPVLLNGAGGTPSSITLTNATGYPNATNAAKGVMEGDGSTISCVTGVCSSIGSASTAVTLLTTTATGGAVGDVLSVTSTGCSSTTPCMTQFSPAPITNSLSADVTMNNTANYFPGPTIAQGTTGTWWASGSATLIDSAGIATFACKLWDGTTVIDSGEVSSGATNLRAMISLSGYISSPAGNIRIDCQDLSSTSGKINFNLTGSSKDSTVSAHRIQ